MPRHRHQHHTHRDNADSDRSDHAIPRAIREGNIEELRQRFLRAQGDGSLTDTILSSALCIACEKDNFDMMAFLVEEAASHHINAILDETKKETLLMRAKSKGIAQLLLSKGAEVNAVDDTGRSALMHATSKDVAEVLIDAKADLETNHKQAKSALLHVLGLEGSSMANIRGEVAHLLIKRGADVDAADSKGRTVLMTAVWQNHSSVVLSLLSKNVKIEARDIRGRNVLHHLCEDEARAQRMIAALKDPDESMVKLVVNMKVNVNTQERLNGQTPLHLAIARNNVVLAQELLRKNSINIEKPDFAGRRPIHVAAAVANDIMLRKLIEAGADVNAEAKGGMRPLHYAAEAADDPRTDFTLTVETLLSNGAEPTARLWTGKSPLHLACEAGKVNVVKKLLAQRDDAQREADIMARDGEGDTPLMSAAKSGQSFLVKLLTPMYLSRGESEDVVRASKGFAATIVDFAPGYKKGNRRENRPMYDLLFEKFPISPNLPADASSDVRPSPTLRWIHCPSNNITWCQKLLLKRFLELDGADADNFKAMEKSFNNQHRGTTLHAHYMRPTCQIVPQMHSEEDIDTVQPRRAVDPEIAVSTDRNALFPHIYAERGRSTSSRSERNPARRGHGTNSSETTLRTVDHQGMRHNATTPSSSPVNQDTLMNNNMFMFMPYLHYEVNSARERMQKTISEATSRKARVKDRSAEHRHGHKTLNGSSDAFGSEEDNRTLLFAHVNSKTCSMNARRTLDQYYYRTVDTTVTRDHDQVVHRYQKNHPSPLTAGEDIRLLMVDQLWLWIVGKDLVMTSFPQRWGTPKDDAHNVLETILGDINSSGRGSISSAYELVFMIASRCFGAFDRHNTKEGEMLFLDMFESSIGDAMDRETALFRNFNEASEEASHWLRLLTSPGKASYMFEQPSRAPKLHENQPAGVATNPKTKEQKQGLVATLLNIGEETNLMRDIKDIRDELSILRMIFEEQNRLLSQLRKTLLQMIHRDRGSRALANSIERMYTDAEPDITNPLRDIERMYEQAGRIYDSVRDLLDLKQNYAVSMQAADTARQGRTLMVFTVVTVIFLPLSFLTAFFALDIKEFPHDRTGNQELPLGFVSKFVFGVGFVIAVLSVLLALAWERLSTYFRRGRKREWHFLHKKKHAQARAEHESSGTRRSRTASWRFMGAGGRSNTAQSQTMHLRNLPRDVEREDV